MPCIVGAGGICSFVQTGDRLRIDPNTGTIDINVTPNGPTSMPYAGLGNGSAPSSMPYAIGNGAPSTVSEQGSVAPSMPLSAWLAANNLQACAPVLARLGYDQGVDMLVESDNEESRDMIRAVRSSSCWISLWLRGEADGWAGAAGCCVSGDQKARREEVRERAREASHGRGLAKTVCERSACFSHTWRSVGLALSVSAQLAPPLHAVRPLRRRRRAGAVVALRPTQHLPRTRLRNRIPASAPAPRHGNKKGA